jgi:hypothetical protein
MKTIGASLLVAAALSVSTGCSKYESRSEVEWAKSALARNPAFEILATDASAGVFTVRDTASGEVRTLRLEELVAAPLPAKAAARPNPTPASTAAPAETPAPADAPATADAIDQTTELMAVQRDDNGRGNGATLAEGPGYSITRGTEPAAAASSTLEGPGYSITRAAPSARADRASAEAATSAAANVERRTDPIICQGDRLMRIDGETLEFTGDALIAEKGCDLYISNARIISAGGVGIIARQARVHIVNSTIGGSRGSYEASDGAELYVAQSTFSGVGRRFDTATMNDLGGNEYE